MLNRYRTKRAYFYLFFFKQTTTSLSLAVFSIQLISETEVDDFHLIILFLLYEIIIKSKPQIIFFHPYLWLAGCLNGLNCLLLLFISRISQNIHKVVCVD